MRTLVEQLSQYAAYHRDRRNIATHFVGIPMIVLAVVVLASRPTLDAGNLPFTPSLATALIALSTAYYLRLSVTYGLVMGALLALCHAVGAQLATQTTATWLTWGLGLFVAGWAIQFVGHVFEGRKPAFVDDIMGLVVGPLFVVAEMGFLLGLDKPLQDHIEARAGATRSGRHAV